LKPKTAFEKGLQMKKAFQTLIISFPLAMGPSVNDAAWKPRSNRLNLKCKETRISMIPVVLQKCRELLWMKQKLLEDLSVLELFEIIKPLD
jgi:hypothetical protein